jgi:hypothetical protein
LFIFWKILGHPNHSAKFEHLIEAHYQMNREKYDRDYLIRIKDEQKQKLENQDQPVEAPPDRPGIDAPEFEQFRAQIRNYENILTNLASQIYQADMNVLQLQARHKLYFMVRVGSKCAKKDDCNFSVTLQ